LGISSTNEINYSGEIINKRNKDIIYLTKKFNEIMNKNKKHNFNLLLKGLKTMAIDNEISGNIFFNINVKNRDVKIKDYFFL
jgi:hypothetical protein